MSASDALGLFGCGLLGLAAIAILIPLRHFPRRVRYTFVAAAAFAFLIPIGDLPVAAYVRGVTGDLSAATLVLAGATCFTQVTGRALIGRRDKLALCWPSSPSARGMPSAPPRRWHHRPPTGT